MTLTRRRLLGLAALGALAGCGPAPPRTVHAPAGVTPSAGTSAWSIPVSTPAAWAAPPVTPYETGLRTAMSRYLTTTPENPEHPLYPGAAAFAAVDGHIAAHLAVGDAVRYAADGSELPAASRVAAGPATVYDLASLTKMFTAVLALRLVERGQLDLAAPAARYVPFFDAKPGITVRMLFTHTSGLSKDTPLTGDTPDERLASVLAQPPAAAPGSSFLYADQNFIVLGAIVTGLASEHLDTLVRRDIAAPLGLADTGYLPPPPMLARIAATEGGLRGTVHDPAASGLGGVAGHAGLFSTAADVARFGQTLLEGGGPLLKPSTVEQLRTNNNARFGGAAAHGLGFDIDQSWYMGRLSGHGAFGHTGFTGTSLVLDPHRKVVLALLSNRVHPSAAWGSANPARKATANVLAV